MLVVMKKRKITKGEQRAAANILTQISFCKDIDEVIETYHRLFEDYELFEDPFTHLPCTPEEWGKNTIEYERQTMIQRYGHCDGLE